ncbi:MAG: transglycosylase SLT domain-containing protein, partial [bacterium]|nr:transglycosylase SLT domain-containing protein [bacterium]
NPPGEGVERWRSVIKRAAGMLHTDLKDWQINNMLKQIQTESGGNPNIVQTVWDVNMASGNPAQGLLQFIPQTFRAWAVPGHTNIHSGLDQILAAIRRLNAMDTWNYIGHGHGWANGGHVFNKQIAWIAEDGDEFVINNRKPNADSLLASAIKQRAEINPNSFSAKIAHIIDGAKFSGSNGYGMAPSTSQASVDTHTAQSYEVTDYSQQIEDINHKLDIIAEKQVKVDGRSFAVTYEKYGSHERNQRNILERRGMAVDVNF